jgi:hypothetical protein
MPSTLDVVNNCLATLGEVPLSNLSEPHEFKSAALSYLDKADRAIQSHGWWYNTEELTLTPAPSTGDMLLPGDCLKVSTGFKSLINSRQTKHNARYVQRGRRIYDLINATYAITEEAELEVQIVRRVPLADLPECIAEYINNETVLRFQSRYDSDSNKRKELSDDAGIARVYAMAEHIRQVRHNRLTSNPTLARLKAITNSARYYR